MALPRETSQVSSGYYQDIDNTLEELIAEIFTSVPSPPRGNVGATSREVGEKLGLSQYMAQQHLRKGVEEGRLAAGLGYRYSVILQREYRTIVYWAVKHNKEERKENERETNKD